MVSLGSYQQVFYFKLLSKSHASPTLQDSLYLLLACLRRNSGDSLCAIMKFCEKFQSKSGQKVIYICYCCATGYKYHQNNSTLIWSDASQCQKATFKEKLSPPNPYCLLVIQRGTFMLSHINISWLIIQLLNPSQKVASCEGEYICICTHNSLQLPTKHKTGALRLCLYMSSLISFNCLLTRNDYIWLHDYDTLLKL